MDFPHKGTMKWIHLDNGMEWLEEKYAIQALRFKKTGEGPTREEEERGARNLEGYCIGFTLMC